MHALEEKNMLTQELEKCRKLVEEIQTEKVYLLNIMLLQPYILIIYINFRLNY